MITIVTRWESSQMPSDLEWRMWVQLRGAFQIDRMVFTPIEPGFAGVNSIEQFPTMEEALAACPGRKIYLEPSSGILLGQMHNWKAADPDVTFVLGNTEYSNKELIDQFPGLPVRINSPGKTDLYGINAAAIALAYWWGT